MDILDVFPTTIKLGNIKIEATRTELEKHLIRVVDLVESSTGKQDFLTRYQKIFGRVSQLDLPI
jgi:hypothetical protein